MHIIKGTDYTGICVVFFCHDGRGNFLMSRRSPKARDEHGKWDIGGGGLKFGEKIENCLAREVKEEYCTDIIDSSFLGYRDVHRKHEGKPTHWIAMDFLVQVTRAQVAIGDPERIEEINWFTGKTMPPEHTLHSQFRTFWQKYLPQIEGSMISTSTPA